MFDVRRSSSLAVFLAATVWAHPSVGLPAQRTELAPLLARSCAVVVFDTAELAFDERPDAITGVETVGTVTVQDAFWGNAPAHFELRTPGGRSGELVAVTSHIPPISEGRRYLAFLTRDAPYFSFSATPWSTFVLVPEYGPEGAWVDPDGRILVGVTQTHLVTAGRRPDLVPQTVPGLQLWDSDPVDVLPMPPGEVLVTLRRALADMRRDVPEPAEFPVGFHLRRRVGAR